MTTGHTAAATYRRGWLRVFVAGLLLWCATVAVTQWTGNTNLIPTLVLLGSFLVPVTAVFWAFERRDTTALSAETLAAAFLVGGVLGVLGASVLETYLLSPSIWMFVGVGLIEEGVKLVALVWLGRRVAPKTTRDGIILGTTVGFGFAAFESAGYALNALVTVQGLSLRALVDTEILRGVLAPVGHGLWTAIIGAALFAGTRNNRYRITPALVVTYLGVSLLHALWDSMHGISVYLTYQWTATPLQTTLFEYGYLSRPTDEQVNLVKYVDIGGLLIISAVGICWLVASWRRGRPGPSLANSHSPARHPVGKAR
jgi:RsiW-degrading membrane proteinase PrsW (M82 family)